MINRKFTRSFDLGTNHRLKRHSDYYTLIASSNSVGFKCRIVAGKNISNSAVTRNHTRRIVAEVLKIWLKDSPILPSLSVLILTKPKITTIKYDQLQQQLLEDLRSVNSFKPSPRSSP